MTRKNTLIMESLLGVFLSCVALFGFGCQAVEYTGRSQMNLVSESDEKKLGVDAYEDILKKTPLSKNQAWQTQLKRVGARISAAAAKPDYQWQFNVLQGKEVNAFCLPGGKVAFWEGIMPIANDDAGIAVVMGHEAAHALARHGAERMTQTMGVQAVGQLLTIGAGMVSPGLSEGFAQAYGLGTNVALILPWGRSQESEADHIGLILMAKAGYDPSSAVGFWERMSKVQQNGKPPEFLSTHPSDETRIAQIKEWLPEAMTYYKKK
ncbi:MAG TPA: M48 family metallopeptidase [Candidatus Binatia bacterium]